MEKLADEWVQKCKFEHPDVHTFPNYNGIGQNIAASFGAQSASYVGLAERWYKEVYNYTYSTNTCAEVNKCGHYTQVSIAALNKTLNIYVYKLSFLDGLGQNQPNWLRYAAM